MASRSRTSTNEYRTCGHFAKAALCPRADTWSEQQKLYAACEQGDRFPWDIFEVRLFPVEATVMSCLMGSKASKMDQELLLGLLADPGCVFLVQDEGTIGGGSLWFMVAETAEESDPVAAYLTNWPVRMIVNSFKIDNAQWRITAVQMPSAFSYGPEQ